MQKNNPAIIFKSAVMHYQNKQLDQAERLCRQLLQIMPDSTDTMHLLGLCLQNKLPQQAEQLFVQATTTSPTNIQYQKTLANFCLVTGRYQQALTIFIRLHTVISADLDVLYGMAFCQYQLQQYRTALETIAHTPLTNHNNEKWYTLKSRILLACDHAEEALNTANLALVHNNQHTGLLEANILALRQLQQPKQALLLTSKLKQEPVKSYLAGCLHYDMHQYELAEQNLQQALALQPDYIDAHVAINKLYLEHNITNKFLQSFSIALKLVPNSLALYLSYISHLVMAEQIKLAVDITQQGLQHFGSQPALLHALGTLYYKQGEAKQAQKLYRQALELMPNNVRCLIDIANLLIKNQAYEEALNLLSTAKTIEPDNQEVWAYFGLCWRLTNNSKQHWLNNYDQLIAVIKLSTPSGYSNFKQFWQELIAAVNALHTTKQQPLDQSVRNGTQTMGSIFNAKVAVIQTYKALLIKHVQLYLAALPQDKEHPLLKRNTGKFRFSGSWSVKLQRNGFHTNHVHPQGWLSVCTYLQIPSIISATDPQQQGWLKLGETSLQLAEKEQISRTICPEEGLCVIFPSYIWHGTVPFSSEEARITLPCDIVPDV